MVKKVEVKKVVEEDVKAYGADIDSTDSKGENVISKSTHPQG